MRRALFAFGLAVLAGSLQAAPLALDLHPKPRLVAQAKGEGTDWPVSVVLPGPGKDQVTADLWAQASKTLGMNGWTDESYALATLPVGALIMASSPQGELRARQTLRQIPLKNGKRPLLTIVDKPEQAWRGIHVLDGGAQGLPAIKRLIHETLAKAKVNVLIYEIDYNFAFKSHPEVGGLETGHPELAEGKRWIKETVRELVEAGRAEGIQVIPEIQSLGHQSWRQPPNALLIAHPEFEEPSDDLSPYRDLNNKKDFYCRSWCPLHPKVHGVFFDLMDEIIDAFDTKYFHVGMDEVFLLASKNCPRCKGKDHAKLYADEVIKLHDHLKSKGVTMMMWADRFLDGEATGYGMWEASTKETGLTAPALAKMPKDIVFCDWHYDGGVKGKYPSLDIFLKRGNKVWPTVFRDVKNSQLFMREATAVNNPNMMGTLASIWYPAERMQLALEGQMPVGKDKKEAKESMKRQLDIAQSMVTVLEQAWSGEFK